MLVAGLACVTEKSLYMFEVNMVSLSIPPHSVTKIPNNAGIPVPPVSNISSIDANINAANLGPYNVYDVGI